jgi:hypothetical protein
MYYVKNNATFYERTNSEIIFCSTNKWNIDLFSDYYLYGSKAKELSEGKVFYMDKGVFNHIDNFIAKESYIYNFPTFKEDKKTSEVLNGVTYNDIMDYLNLKAEKNITIKSFGTDLISIFNISNKTKERLRKEFAYAIIEDEGNIMTFESSITEEIIFYYYGVTP